MTFYTLPRSRRLSITVATMIEVYTASLGPAIVGSAKLTTRPYSPNNVRAVAF